MLFRTSQLDQSYIEVVTLALNPLFQMAIAIENNMNKLLIIAGGLTLIGAGCERFMFRM